MLSVIGLEQSEQWDRIVRSFADYDVYWLSGYVKAFRLHGDGEPFLFFYEGNGVRGINVVMRRDIAQVGELADSIEPGTYFDFSSPYGYGGWIVEGEESACLFEEYERWCQEHNIVSEFVRFHPVLENHIYLTERYEVTGLGKTITMNLESPDTIWNNITSKNRNMIRKAQKNGIRVYQARNAEIYETFREIYDATMDKDNADKYYYFSEDFYKSVLENLPYNALVFYAEYEKQVIAASIMLAVNGKMNYHLSGSVREFSNLAPTNLLLYEAAMWGCNNGYKTLYLGGGVGSGEDTLFKFKKSFYRREDLNRFYIGKKIFNQEKYDEFTALRHDLPENSYFPRYRA